MTKLSVVEEEPWYKDGLRFECTGCGQCCTGAPGYVWVTNEEIGEIGKSLNMDVEAFKAKFTRQVGSRISLNEDAQSFDCVFLKDKRCQIYSVRPKQCKTYPWWVQNLKSAADWAEAAKECEGISCKAPLVPVETIQEQKWGV